MRFSLKQTRSTSNALVRWASQPATFSPQSLASVTIPRLSENFTVPHLRWISWTPSLFEIHTVKSPAFAESVSSGDIRWTKEVGEVVAVDETIAEIETDKTSIPVITPVAGAIEEFLIEEGGTVIAHQDLAKIDSSKAGEVSSSAVSTSKLETSSTPQEAKVVEADIPTSPPAVQSPIVQPVKQIPVSDVKPIAAQRSASEDVVGGFSRKETRVKMNRMRLKIAKRLKEAQNTAAMLTTFNEIDMSNAIELRNKNKDMFLKKHDLKLSFMSAFIKASVYALQDSPIVNAVIDDNTNEIVYRDYIDISVAVSTEKGLVVPVLRNCNDMNYVDIERGLSELSKKARSNSLAIEDMDGGTFTISNGGVFGSLFGTPILNPPQSAILGMHNITERPVAINGKVEVRPVMFVALTYDHRLLDGREAVLFLRKIKSAIEDPRMMLLDL